MYRWYNVPPKQPASQPSTSAVGNPVAAAGDSRPFDFNTFVPTHDASLGAAMMGGEADGEVAWAGRDAAFGNAMSAMYWAGYWAAVYHVRLPPLYLPPFLLLLLAFFVTRVPLFVADVT